jgi:hypothetical protein
MAATNEESCKYLELNKQFYNLKHDLMAYGPLPPAVRDKLFF